MEELRDVIAEIIGDGVFEYADNCDGLCLADRILAIPVLKDALEFKRIADKHELGLHDPHFLGKPFNTP